MEQIKLNNISISKNESEVHDIQEFLSLLGKVKKRGSNKWQARCPVHEDKTPSLSITVNEEGIALYCQAGCTTEDIVAALGLEMKDLFFDSVDDFRPRVVNRIVATYDYVDENQDLKYQVVKKSNKEFRQRRPDGKGNWIYNLQGVKRILYRLPEVLRAIQDRDTIYIVEGEKDADNLSDLGFVTTCNSMGAGKWKDSYSDTLRGAKEVIILPDNDQPGRDHAEAIADSLHSKVETVKILELPGLKPKEDVSDWLEKRGGNEKLLETLSQIELEYNPSEIEVEEFSPTQISKAIITELEGSNKKIAYVSSQDLFYLYSSAQGYWRSYPFKATFIDKLIRDKLVHYNPKWDKDYRVTEVKSRLKEILYNPDGDDRFTIANKALKLGENLALKYINVQNGMVNWQTNKLLEHSWDYYSLYQLPINYDPEAKCPLWLKSLKQWVSNSETRAFLQEYIGYCVIPDTSLAKAIILYGKGSNGKGVFLEVVQELIGVDNCSDLRIDQLTKDFENVLVKDKLVNIQTDIDPVYLRNTGVIKSMIAGETITGAFKFQDPFSFRPVARLMFSANEIPKTRDKSKGWQRRFEIVEFPNQFSPDDDGYDRNLKAKLFKELPGIFNWALEGLRRLFKRERFVISDSMYQIKQDYQRDNDNIITFIDECLMVTNNENDRVPTQALYQEYKSFCELNGFTWQNRNIVTRRVIEELNVKKKTARVNYNGEIKPLKCLIGITIRE